MHAREKARLVEIVDEHRHARWAIIDDGVVIWSGPTKELGDTWAADHRVTLISDNRLDANTSNAERTMSDMTYRDDILRRMAKDILEQARQTGSTVHDWYLNERDYVEYLCAVKGDAARKICGASIHRKSQLKK